MKKILSLFALIVVSNFSLISQNIYVSENSHIRFFSETPMENIEAINKESKSLINTNTKEIAVIIGIRNFKFEKPLMEEHFNENYLESDKYKTSTFKGKIVEPENFDADGEYKLVVKGLMEIKGVKKERELVGTLVKKGDTFAVKGTFQVALKDHEIKVPKIVVKNIAETIDVFVDINYKLKQK
jgi:hypothetical protein